MKKAVEETVLQYIDRYRVVTLSNLIAHFTKISKFDLIAITTHLYKRGNIKYESPKDKNPNKTFYFSKAFNPEGNTTIFDNGYMAISKCLTVLETFRKYYTITYEELGFFPTVIKFGLHIDGEDKNVQLVFLPYSENNEFAKYIGGLLNEDYDKRYDVIRYVVLEVKGMLSNNSPCQIADYIPRTVGLAVCQPDNTSAKFYSINDFRKD